MWFDGFFVYVFMCVMAAWANWYYCQKLNWINSYLWQIWHRRTIKAKMIDSIWSEFLPFSTLVLTFLSLFFWLFSLFSGIVAWYRPINGKLFVHHQSLCCHRLMSYVLSFSHIDLWIIYNHTTHINDSWAQITKWFSSYSVESNSPCLVGWLMPEFSFGIRESIRQND